MKKTIAIFITISLLLISCSFCFADVKNTKTSGIMTWNQMHKDGNIVLEDGILKLVNPDIYKNHIGYNEIIQMIDFCNDQVRSDIILVDTESLTYKMNISIQGTSLELVKDTVDKKMKGYKPNNILKGPAPDTSWHSNCTLPSLDLINLCNANYQSIQNYIYNSMVANNYNPNLDYTVMGMTYWIMKVRNYGDWDYKRVDGFKPSTKQFCWINSSLPEHITSEYIGNFNYGFTGSLFFNLTTLHYGSMVVAGYSPADFNDWAAIDRGYYW